MNDATDIMLNIDLNADDAIKEAKKLSKEIKETLESRSGSESSRITNIDIQLKKLGQTVDKVREKVEDIGSRSFMTKEYEEATNQLIKLEQQYDRLINKTEKMNATEQKRQDILAEIANVQRERENQLEFEYEFMLMQLSAGKTNVTPYTDTESIKIFDAEITKLQEKLNQLQYVKLDNWYNDLETTKRAVEELKESLYTIEVSGTATIPGTETEAYKQAVQQLDNYNNAIQLGLAKRVDALRKEEEAKQKSAEKLEKINQRQAEAEEKRALKAEEARIKEQEKLERDVARAEEARQREADKAEKEAQKIIDAEERMKQKLQERADAAEEAAERHANSYNRVRESLMGIQSTTRGIARLIPGLNTSAIYGVTAVTRGVSRLASMTKKELLGAVNVIKNAFLKLIALIAAHPIIAGIIAIIGVLAILISKFVEMQKRIKESITEASKLFADFAKGVLTDTLDLMKKYLKELTKLFAIISTISIQVLIKSIDLLINKLSSLIKIVEDTFKALASLNDGVNETNQALSNLVSSLDYVEAAFSVAFKPILTIVEPLLTHFIDLAAETMNTIGMLFAKLMGKDSYTKAVKKQKDFNAELDKTKKKAKKASESLAPFDKLNVISKSNTGSTDDIKDLLADFEDVDLSAMTLEEIIEQLKTDGAEMGQSLKDSLGEIKWDEIKENAKTAGGAVAEFANAIIRTEGLGDKLGEALGETINSITSFIGEFFGQLDTTTLGQQIAAALSSAIEAWDPELAGDSVSKVVNAIIDAIGSFFKSLKKEDVVKLSNKMGRALRKALSGIKWDKAHDTVKELIDDLVTFLNTFITPENFAAVGSAVVEAINLAIEAAYQLATDINWQLWGASLAAGLNEFIRDTDWRLAAETAGKIANGILDSIITAITGGEIEVEVTEATAKMGLQATKFKDGKLWQKEIVEGLDFDKLGDALIDFVTNIPWETIITKASEISKKLGEAFDNVWEKLQASDGFDGLIDTLVAFWIEKKKWETRLEGVGSTIEDAVEEELKPLLWDEAAGYLMEGIVKGCLGWLTSPDVTAGAGLGALVTPMIEAFENVFGIASPSTVMEDSGIGKWLIEGIIAGFDAVDFASEMQTWFDTNVKPWFSEEKWTNMTDTMTKGVKAQMTILKNSMTGNWVLIKTKTGEKVDKMITSIVKKFNTLETTLGKNEKRIKDGFVDMFKDMKKEIKDPINSILDSFQTMINNIISGFNSLIDKLNTFKFDMPDWLDDSSSGKSFNLGINKISGSVSIPKLAQGTVIPANMSKFLAVLGDNNRETEVVSPLSTIEQALANVLANQNLNVTFTVEGDPHGMFKVMQKEASNYTRATGRLAF